MQVKLISFQKKENLSIVQFLYQPANTFDYISSKRAIERDDIQVEEVNPAGSINNIKVINNSFEYVFFCEGDILRGAKQNRVVNTSLLIPPLSTNIIKVSCIEQGRWSNISTEFNQSDYFSPMSLRATLKDNVNKNLFNFQNYSAEQTIVWNEVHKYCLIINLKSKTKNLEEIFKKEENTIKNTVKEFISEENANGIAIFIGLDLVAIDIFNRTDIYKEYFPKLISSATIDLNSYPKKNTIIDQDYAFVTTENLLSSLENIDSKLYTSIGVGKHKRYFSEKISGFTLSYQGKMIHTSLSIKN